MSTYPSWVDQRILLLVNQARSPEDFTNNPDLGDDPKQDGKGYFIGPTVAQRILDQRQALPRRRYQSIEELLAVEGLGADKLADLRFSLHVTAAQYYENLLRDGILLDNWELQPTQFVYGSELEFNRLVESPSLLQEQLIKVMPPLAGGYLETYTDPHLASFQFGFWWYLFDQDNWFAFAQVQEAAERYLNFHGNGQMDLMLLKKPPNDGYWTPNHLAPVIINRPELTITVWQAALND